MAAITGIQTYRVHRCVHFHHVHKCLYPGDDHCGGRRRIHERPTRRCCRGRRIHERRTQIQDLKCRMCLERITDGSPRYVVRNEATTKKQVNKAFVFFEGARNCKDFSVTDLSAPGKVRCEEFQTTVSAQAIRENNIVNFTRI
jgi:hypothetical protein